MQIMSIPNVCKEYGYDCDTCKYHDLCTIFDGIPYLRIEFLWDNKDSENEENKEKGVNE